jgi:hypothetical protein
VHNTASGYTSIATSNGSPSTTLTGGPELVASSLLEAFGHLARGESEVLVVVADEALQAPFDRADMKSSLALSFCFSSKGDGAMARLDNLRRDSIPAVKPYERFGSLYVSAGLPLLERAVARKPGTIALELARDAQYDRPYEGPHGEESTVWCLDLQLLENSKDMTQN